VSKWYDEEEGGGRRAAGGGGGQEEKAGVQNQKQEPHTKMWGKRGKEKRRKEQENLWLQDKQLTGIYNTGPDGFV